MNQDTLLRQYKLNKLVYKDNTFKKNYNYATNHIIIKKI